MFSAMLSLMVKAELIQIPNKPGMVKNNNISTQYNNFSHLWKISIESEKAKYCMIPTVWYFGKKKTMETIKRVVIVRGWGAGRMNS